jgi:hypothetical protein
LLSSFKRTGIVPVLLLTFNTDYAKVMSIPFVPKIKNMHEKDSYSQDRDPKAKGYYLPHYKGSESPSAMRHPAWDKETESLPDLAIMEPLGERNASDPELIRLTKAYNAAPGQLPETPKRTLLDSLPDVASGGVEMTLASTAAQDEGGSNGIHYLDSGKFVYAVELHDFTDGRDTPKGGRSGRDVINEYKNMRYDTMPPVQHVKAYYEEQSGNTFYALVGDGSHRLAGAVRRGDQYIPATSISYVRLETDVISEKLEQMRLQGEQPGRRRFGRGILDRLGIRKPGGQ